MFERFTAKWKEYMNPILHEESSEELLHSLLITEVSGFFQKSHKEGVTKEK
jgi:hypothetical protein